MSSRTPRTAAGAMKLLGAYADLASRVDLVEADRADAIATANRRADSACEPMIEEMAGIAAALEPWWTGAGHELAGGKKSMELGGCVIGSRKSRPKLAHGFDTDEKAIEALRSTRWAKLTTRVSYSLDRTGTSKLLQLGGKAGQDIASLGFSIEQAEQFFVERAA
jgi:hypothetical protein